MKLAKVKIRKGDGLQLAKQFKCSANWVSRSVNGTVNTEKAQKIRQAAVNMGGDPIYK
jgi:nitroimidazol reductase NimA-like FMN-containing flavoprotein (pyridoxamine 5'-phosphate oxidase superfamily)